MAQEPEQEDKDAGQDKKGKSGWPATDNPSLLGALLALAGVLIAALLALAGVLITQVVTSYIAERNLAAQRELEEQRQREAELQTYFDDMGNLLLNENSPLAEAEPWDPISSLARAKTLTILERLDGQPTSKRNVLQFLYESQLIQKEAPTGAVVSLRNANLSDADLYRADLSGADLIGADLSDADLRGADLIDADLSDADLYRVNLYGADLSDAKEVTVGELELSADSLEGATMPDGSVHD